VHWLNPGAMNVRELACGDERAAGALHHHHRLSVARRAGLSPGVSLGPRWPVARLSFQLAGNSIESIYDLCEAVDWIEREIHEGFAIDFTGREYEPLLLRQGDTPGVNLRRRGEPARGEKMSYKIPMGPYHPALEEPYKLDLICEGETVATPSCISASTSAASSIWPKRATTFRSSR
jgi:hypothetical protein